MRMDVSVIVSAYNVATLIERAVASALAQTGVTLEVILVDDASTDGTWDAIHAMTDSRVKRFHLAVNSGPGAARNHAIAQAKGAWIAVLDGDDILLPQRLERCLALAAKTNADMVVDNLSVRGEANGKRSVMFPPARLAALGVMTVESFIVGNSNFLRGYGFGYMKPIISAQFLKRQGLAYREDIRIGEDYFLMLEALASGARCVVDSNVGYGYTSRAGSLSHRLTMQDVMRIRSEDDQFFASYEVSAAVMQQQQRRERNLHKALMYTAMVDAIKRRDIQQFSRDAIRCPAAAVYLWMPLWVRLRRLMGG